MRKTLLAMLLVLSVPVLSGCESSAGSAILGGAAGAAAGAGGYELHLNRQKNRVEEDFQAGSIDQREYDIRMDQIRRADCT